MLSQDEGSSMSEKSCRRSMLCMYVIMRSDVKVLCYVKMEGQACQRKVADVQRCVSYVIMRSDVKVLC